jgi:hypothetical protein
MVLAIAAIVQDEGTTTKYQTAPLRAAYGVSACPLHGRIAVNAF